MAVDAEPKKMTSMKRPASKHSQSPKKDKPKKRYIVFVGNLSYSTTKADLEDLFQQANPTSIRMMTDKTTGKARGIAFIEFEDPLGHEAALALHHTNFKGRRINVELTAGGGGHKSGARKDKIRIKNEKYAKERRQA